MPLPSSLQIPPPANWQDFQSLCCALWKRIWEDPNTQQNGRLGQKQNGVDIVGQPKGRTSWAGVQCKEKNNYANKSLTEKEIKDEVEKAKHFRPVLSEFIIATTGQTDSIIQELCREITEQNLKDGFFSVTVFFWENIKDILNDDEIDQYCRVETKTNIIKNEIKQHTDQVLENQRQIPEATVTALFDKIINPQGIIGPDIAAAALSTEYQEELNLSRDLLQNSKPEEALDLLENLKSRIWSVAQNIIKFRILTNSGCALLNLNQEKEAAKLFIEALQYNSNDENALCNTALAYLLLGEVEKAFIYTEKTLKLNPIKELAYGLIVEASHPKESFQTIVSKIPNSIENSPDIAYALSNIAFKSNNFLEAKKWCKIAIENDKKKYPELKAFYGTIILKELTEEREIFYLTELSKSKKEKLEEVIKLFDEAWNRISTTSLRNYKLEWLLNRSIAKRLVGDRRGAISDTEFVLGISPNNALVIKQRAILAIEDDDKKYAIKLLEKIINEEKTLEANLILAELLASDDKINDAIKILINFLSLNPQSDLKEEAQRLLIGFYLDLNDINEAKNISAKLRNENPTNIINLVLAARIEKFVGNNSGSASLLEEARKYSIDVKEFRDLLTLANELYFIKKYEDAATLYEKIVDKNINNQPTYMLVSCYYQSGKLKEALSVCENLRMQYGPLKQYAEIESAIYEEIGNLPKAKEICSEYLKIHPTDFEISLRNARINFLTDNVNDLDDFLNSSIDTETLPLNSCLLLIDLYSKRGRDQNAFKLAYEARRRLFNEPEVHLAFVNLCFDKEKNNETLLNPTKVSEDTAVQVKDSNGQKEWYIIEKRKDADLRKREINVDHHIAINLMGRSEGDIVVIDENPLSKYEAKIDKIQSKYVYALQETMNSFGRLFPRAEYGIWRVPIALSEKGGTEANDFNILANQIKKSNETLLKVEQFYKDGKVTVGAIANLIDRNVIDVWGYMLNQPSWGLKCSTGIIDDANLALCLIKENRKLIIDIISLMTINGLNLEKSIIDKFGKIGIAQSTVTLLKKIISDFNGLRQKGFIALGLNGHKLTKRIVTEEDSQQGIQYLQKIQQWIETNCEILPCKKALVINRYEKHSIDNLLGNSFVDTILIASEVGNLLYSDDERLRSFAKAEFNVEGTWTQILLQHLLDDNKIQRDEYNKAIIKLVCSNYYFISIDANILMEAASQSDWLPTTPYINLIHLLNGNVTSEPSSLYVTVDFLLSLWKLAILPDRRAYLVLSLLDNIVEGRIRNDILKKLVLKINVEFQHNSPSSFKLIPQLVSE